MGFTRTTLGETKITQRAGNVEKVTRPWRLHLSVHMRNLDQVLAVVPLYSFNCNWEEGKFWKFGFILSVFRLFLTIFVFYSLDSRSDVCRNCRSA